MINYLFTKKESRFRRLINSFLLNGIGLIFLFLIPNIGISAERGKGPFFWQIEREGKNSYVLGTTHRGVNFSELKCYEEIKNYLVSTDFLLTERHHSEKDKSKRVELIEEKNAQIEKENDLNYYELINLYQNELCSSYPAGSDINMDEQVFLNFMIVYPLFISTINRVMTSSCYKRFLSLEQKSEKTFIEEEEIKTLKIQCFQPLEDFIAKFTGTLDDIQTEVSVYYERAKIVTEEDWQEWEDNSAERCSESNLTALLNHKTTVLENMRERFKSGELNIEEDFEIAYWSHSVYLDAEIKLKAISATQILQDFRNQRWLPKIVEAFSTYNSIFVAAGLVHFTAQHRNPHNRPELEDYVEANKNLPTNVLDMLEKEGFTVKRMKADCSFD